MTDLIKEEVLSALHAELKISKEQLHDAEETFTGLSPTEMEEPWGAPMKTPIVILAEYKARERFYLRCIEWVENIDKRPSPSILPAPAIRISAHRETMLAGYTKDQMLKLASDVILDEREACAKLVAGLDLEGEVKGGGDLRTLITSEIMDRGRA